MDPGDPMTRFAQFDLNNIGGFEMSANPKAQLPKLPQRLHHNARVVKDHERTRHFYEDIVGMPLLATWSEVGQFPDFPERRISLLPHVLWFSGRGCARVLWVCGARRVRGVQGQDAIAI